MNTKKDTIPETWNDKLSKTQEGHERIYSAKNPLEIISAFNTVRQRNAQNKDLFVMYVGARHFTIKCLVRNDEAMCNSLKRELSRTMDLSKLGVPSEKEITYTLPDEIKLKLFLHTDNGYVQLFQYWLKNALLSHSLDEIDILLTPLINAVCINISDIDIKID